MTFTLDWTKRRLTDWTTDFLARGDEFRPPSIQGNVLWLDAADTSTITDTAGLVSQWDDKSGQGNNVTQGVGANQPTTNASTQNGLNIIDFDGSDTLSVAVQFDPPHTIFIAAEPTNNNRSLITQGESRAANNMRDWDLFGNGTDLLWVGTQGGGANFQAQNTYPTLAPHVFTAAWNATTDANAAFIRVDGAAFASATASSASFNSSFSLNVGGEGGSFNLIGSIYEVIIYDRYLSSTEIAEVESYLANKWGI